MRFLQVSDVHLGSRVGLNWLSPAQCEELTRCVRDTFRRAMLLAKERSVDAVLIPGDLFDDESVHPEHVSWAVSCIREIAPIPVFIAPGNHDPLWPGSPYHSMWAQRYPQSAWPENAHVFTSPTFQTLTSADGRFSVTSLAHTQSSQIQERLLSEKVDCGATPTRILMVHGSYKAVDLPEKDNTLPFTTEDLERQQVSWIAAGHYHSARIFADENGKALGAYSGCPQGRGLDECGPKGALLIETTSSGVTAEFCAISSRSLWKLSVDVTGKGLPEIMGAVENAAVEHPGGDLLYVQFTGRIAREISLEMQPGFMTDRFYAFTCDTSQVVPDYDIDALMDPAASEGLPGRFVRRIQEMKQSGAEDQSVLDEALYLGLDAIYGKAPNAH
ncbi:MAG: metallophosphoesterase [Armatimonadetes bacterium]|nr:metallophosphoesterase [Armatimonadota bacterium]